MKTIDFSIKFRDKIERGTYKVTCGNQPVRIICWDFKGLKTPDATTPLPIIALVDGGDFEKILHVTEDGVAYDRDLSGIMRERAFKLQVTYQDLPNKLTRVKYCLAKADVFTDNLMKEFGYEYDSNKSHYYNRIGFINDFAKRYMNLFYRKLKLSGHWEYDDEEDWNLDFKEGDYVECICNDGPWVLAIGDIYRIICVEQSGRITIEDFKDDRALTIGESDFIDMFKHLDCTKPESETSIKIKDKFDFSRMKAFTPVLARPGDHQTWFPHFFESYHPQNHLGEFYMIDCGRAYSQCVPFEGNEKLLRTQDPIPPFYDIR